MERAAKLASQIHDAWRKPRWREKTKDYKPEAKKTKDQEWIKKHGGVTELDIANTSYEDLPEDWQAESKASAKAAITEVEKAMEKGLDMDDKFLESTSSVIHGKWLERNGALAPAGQKKPYQELSEEEKEKDRGIIKQAIEICSGK